MEGEPSASPVATTNLISKRKVLCGSQPQPSPLAEDSIHLTRVASSYRNRDIFRVVLARLCHGSRCCYRKTSAAPCPPCFLPNSNAFACITQPPAPQHCPLTQAAPLLGSSTTQMSKTGKIFPHSVRVLHWPVVGINHRLLHDFLAPTIYIISQ